MIKLRIPTKDQYAFIEEDYEGDNPKGRYDELYTLMNAPIKPVDAFLDELVVIIKNNLKITNIDQYNGYSLKQQLVLKEIKNLVSRAVDKYKK